MKVVSSNELASLLERRSYPRVVASGNAGAPWSLLKVLDATVSRYRLFMLNAPAGIPNREGVAFESPFVGPGMRGSTALSYVPCRLSLVPRLLTEHPADIVLCNTSPPRAGKVSLGVEVNVLPAAIEATRSAGGLVVAQLNGRMPYTFGDGELDVDDIDIAVEVDESLSEIATGVASDVHQVIGENVAHLVPDGATLQVGIGSVPDCALSSLRSRELRVFTELLGDGLLDLARRGAFADEPLVTSFAMGSQELYSWLDRNGDVTFRRTEFTNHPGRIAAQPIMTSINAAIQVDLDGQANATHVRGNVYSGFGGQSDFVEGALHSSSGRSLIALPSWHEPTATSTIVRRFDAPVTSFQHSFVVTDCGHASIFGSDAATQRASLIAISDPRARDELLSVR